MDLSFSKILQTTKQLSVNSTDARLEKDGYRLKSHVIVSKDRHEEVVIEVDMEVVMVVVEDTEGDMMEEEEDMIVHLEEEIIVQDEEIAEVHQEEEEVLLQEDEIAEVLQEEEMTVEVLFESEVLAVVQVQETERIEARVARLQEEMTAEVLLEKQIYQDLLLLR